MNEESVFNIIHEMICSYKEFTHEEPYIILVSPKCYDYLIKIQISTKQLTDTKSIKKIKTVFGVPIEISNYINQEAICMNKNDYKEYCMDKFNLEILFDRLKDEQNILRGDKEQ